MPPWGGVTGRSIWEEIPGQTQDMLEILHLSAGLGMPWNPPKVVGSCGRGEESLGFPAETAALATQTSGG